jgi:hypothetical protein
LAFEFLFEFLFELERASSFGFGAGGRSPKSMKPRRAESSLSA